ncbi:DUF429 domain-containing protein [Aminobacter anthyllidis]|uniref:DUF429 domain-containing protein n=1 Tax=Aminobacter anthyllidis TaxID=1035067 RepID=A0A9X1AG79_9HYPH|nr:DUF429 domain-containing protein [Aminobacter anthyllidis]MBT1159073.1 DUF429 domain-containing protein [Aminobacter anthyllidis]
MIILGFDPGGEKKFGCVIMDLEGNSLDSYIAESVDDAIAWTFKSVGGAQPVAAGIDTLLFWQSTKSGWRGADQYLRSAYPACRSSILCANGLYGSMSVQGAVLAHRLRQKWPKILLTETHPKVLWHHITAGAEYPRNWQDGVPEPVASWLQRSEIDAPSIAGEDEFDALLSAWAAGQAYKKNWTRDLSELPASNQNSENIYLVQDINYFWPD